MVIFWPGFRILDMSGSQNIQFCMRNPMFRSKITIVCVQTGKIRKNEIRKNICLVCFFFLLFFLIHSPGYIGCTVGPSKSIGPLAC